MWWSDASKSPKSPASAARRFAVLGMLALAGCGFTPVYGPDGSGQALRGQLLVDAPTTRNGFSFVNRVEQRLGRNSAAPLALSYKITTAEDGIAITSDREIQRYNLIGRIDYTLSARGTGAQVLTGQVDSFTSYSATGTTVATLAAERDAAERLMVILADLLVTRLEATAPALPQ